MAPHPPTPGPRVVDSGSRSDCAAPATGVAWWRTPEGSGVRFAFSDPRQEAAAHSRKANAGYQESRSHQPHDPHQPRAGDRARRRAAGDHGGGRGPVGGGSPRARPRRSSSDGAAPGVPHHGLRQVQVRAGQGRASGQEEAALDPAQGDQVPPRHRRPRFRVQVPARETVSRGRQQGEGDDDVPGAASWRTPEGSGVRFALSDPGTGGGDPFSKSQRRTARIAYASTA